MVDILEFEDTNDSSGSRRQRAGNRRTDHAWYYKSIPCYKLLPVSSILPGDNKSSDRSSNQGQESIHLVGLKENVIIGKHIPAGTGMRKYRDIKLGSDYALDDELSFAEDDDIEIGEMNDVDDITENVVEEDGVIIE